MDKYSQNILLTSSKYKEEKDYWIKKLDGGIRMGVIPADYPHSKMVQGKMEILDNTFSDNISRNLNKVCNRSENAIYIFLLTGVIYLIHRYSYENEMDMVVGMPGLQQASTLMASIENNEPSPLRITFNTNDTFKDLLLNAKTTVVEARKYRNIPFSLIMQLLNLPPAEGDSSLFKTIVLLENIHLNEKVEKSYADTVFSFITREDRIHLRLAYNPGLFCYEKIKKLYHHLANIFEAVISNPMIKLSEIEILSEDEKNLILYSFNNTKAEYPGDKTIHQLFEEQVERTPGQIAIIGEQEEKKTHLSYRELNERSGELAKLLIEKGVLADNIVGLMMERSLNMIIGIWGILKSGGAYLPIDPDYPQERIDYILRDSGAAILLTDEKKINCQLSIVNSQLSINGRPRRGLHHSMLAYVIYTSGSTGKPKGVMIEHRSVINFITGITGFIPLTENDRILSLTTISFDIFGLETIVPLTLGCKVIIGGKLEQLDALASESAIRKEKITALQVTPSRLQLLLSTKAADSLKLLKYLMVGGEAFPAPLLDTAKNVTKGKIFNLYGPTETTIWSTVKDVTGEKPLNIGRPMANTRIYILDKNYNIRPTGVAGDLYIAGDGLARGYLNRPELTAEKFIHFYHSSFIIQHSKLYRTGDMARWLPDGEIEFLGRIDTQVKIRGFRIELEEIEAQLANHENIKEAVVKVIGESNENSYLCAYIVPASPDISASLNAELLRQYMEQKLPFYMIPSRFIELKRIPLTPNGKIDRKALPTPDQSHTHKRATFVAPATEKEKMIAEAWKEVLCLEQIGIHDNFFALGGNSLMLINLNRKLGEILSRDIPIIEMFKYLTIHDFISRYLTVESPDKAFQKKEALQEEQLEQARNRYISAAVRKRGQVNG